MTRAGSGLIDRLSDKRALRRWTAIARASNELSIEELRRARSRARALHGQLSAVLVAAEARLTLPFSGRGAIREAVDADWAWRPDLWRGPIFPPGLARAASGDLLGDAVKIFHDCPKAENAIRQQRNTRDDDLAPYGIRVDVFAFEGSFLSFVVDLPDDALSGLNRGHVVKVAASMEAEAPVTAFVRLNIKHGPNTETLVQDLPSGAASAEFDLGFANFNEARVEGAWAELIFDRPEMNQIVVRDFTLSRRPRAEL